MTRLDDRLVPKVKKIIARFGKDLTFVTSTRGTHNPRTNSVVGSPRTVEVVKGTPPSDVTEDLIANDLVKAGDAVTFIAALGIVGDIPKLEQQVEFDGKKFKTVTFEPFYTGELIALYQVILRKA